MVAMGSMQGDDLQLQGDVACENAEVRGQLKVAGQVITPGGGGGIGPGTPNALAKFTTPTEAGDSNVSDDGAAVAVAVPLRAIAQLLIGPDPNQAIIEPTGTLLVIYTNAANPGGLLRIFADALQVRNAADAYTFTIDVATDPGKTLLSSTGQLTVDAPAAALPSQIGFGVNPIARQSVTGSHGGNAALISLLTALNAMGLIANNTTR